MKIYKFILFALSLSSFAAFSQTPQEAVAQMIRTKLGEQCLIQNEEGKQITFIEAADKTIGASVMGKRVKYEPIRVIEGISYEVRMKLVDPTVIKPLLDEIDFANERLGFYNQTKQKISKEEFKSTIQANSALVAAVFNATNGLATDYYIITKPKPASVQVVSSDSNNPSNSISTSSTAGQVSSTAVASPLAVGNAMPDFKLTDIYGKKWSSKELKSKIVVLNFWFVECPPCIAEMPSLNRLVEKYKNNGQVVFLAIANSGREKIKEFLTKREFNYVQIAREQSKSYLADWEIQSYPQNMVVNKGNIAFSFTGGTNSNDDFIFNLLSEEIEKCLKG